MSSNEITIEKLLLMLRKHVRFIAVMFTASVLIAIVITLLTPKMYTATTTLNFDIKGINPLVDSRGIYAEETYITTQVGIIESLNVAQEVESSLSDYEREKLVETLDAKGSFIDNLSAKASGVIASFIGDEESDATESMVGIEREAEAKGLDVRSAYNWVVRSIGYDLKVEPVFNSRIVEISYSSTDPQMAALMADRYTRAYIATNLRMTTDPARRTKMWFDQQLKSLREQLKDAQTTLTEYQRQEGIVYSDERVDTESERLQDLTRQLVQAQQETRNSVTERQKLKEVVDSGASLMTSGTIFSNSVIQNIKSEIRKLESDLVEISSSLGKNHPKHRRIRSELGAARTRLKKEIQSVLDGVNNQAELVAAREKDLSNALEAQKQLVLDLKHERDQIAVLNREVESAQMAYNTALNEMNTTNMQSLVDQTNVSIVDSANVPRRHSFPVMTKNVVLGALVGLALAIGITIFKEILIRRIHSKEDILKEVGVPLLGHLKKA